MTVHLVTGHYGKIHVTSDDQARFNAYLFGKGTYVINGCELTAVDENTVHIGEGTLLIEGRHINIADGGEDVYVPTGTVDKKRRDLICIKYSMNSTTGIEKAELVDFKGDVADTYITPVVEEASILAGDNPVLVPIYRIDINARLQIVNPVSLADNFKTYAEAYEGISELRKEADSVLNSISGEANKVLSQTQSSFNSTIGSAKKESQEIIDTLVGCLEDVRNQLNIQDYATKVYVEQYVAENAKGGSGLFGFYLSDSGHLVCQSDDEATTKMFYINDDGKMIVRIGG